MQDFKIERTKKSPEIIFDSSTNFISINGRSVMRNMEDNFFHPVFKVIEELTAEKTQNFTLAFNLDYFNTSSHLSIIKLFRSIDNMYSNGIDTTVIWSYYADDVEMKEIGEEIQKLCKVKFTYQEIN